MKKIILVAILLCALFAILASRQVGAQAQTTAGLQALIAALADGPLQLRPSIHFQGAVSAQTAAQTARQGIGIPFGALHARLVTMTDHENLSRPAHGLPCWIVPSSHPVTFSIPNGKSRYETLYAIVDARTGLLLEAFTKPRAAWWRRISPTNETFIDSLTHTPDEYGGLGVKAVPAVAPPHIPLAGSFHGSGSNQIRANFSFFPAAARADQFIARYFIYTDFGVTLPNNTLQIEKKPLWYVSLEGLNMPFIGPILPPRPGQVQKMSLPRTEEWNVLLDSTTGEEYETSELRSGLTKDAIR